MQLGETIGKYHKNLSRDYLDCLLVNKAVSKYDQLFFFKGCILHLDKENYDRITSKLI